MGRGRAYGAVIGDVGVTRGRTEGRSGRKEPGLWGLFGCPLRVAPRALSAIQLQSCTRQVRRLDRDFQAAFLLNNSGPCRAPLGTESHGRRDLELGLDKEPPSSPALVHAPSQLLARNVPSFLYRAGPSPSHGICFLLFFGASTGCTSSAQGTLTWLTPCPP